MRRELEGDEISFEITLHGNSGFLNAWTDDFAEVAVQLAMDIAPLDGDLQAIAADAGVQLRDQRVPRHPGEIVLLPTWASRAASQRVQGEASIAALLRELELHERRLLADLKSFHRATGPKAWKKRAKMQVAARIDALAIVNCARRMERVVQDLQVRLDNNAHVKAALLVFRERTSEVTDLRNISEHLDEYVVGGGRMDVGAPVEPGDVFDLQMRPDDVALTARFRNAKMLDVAAAVRVLIRCVQSTTEARFMEITYADGIDFDCAVVEDDGSMRVLKEQEYTADILQLKTALARTREKGTPLSQQVHGSCAACGSLF